MHNKLRSCTYYDLTSNMKSLLVPIKKKKEKKKAFRSNSTDQ